MEAAEVALISLYNAVEPEFDVSQLGDADQVGRLSADPSVAMPELTASLNLELRRDRYAANLAYVLGVRFMKGGGSLDSELRQLGGAIVARFGHSDPFGGGEAALRAAVSELIDDARISESVAEALTVAFEGKVMFALDPDTEQWSIDGSATENALLLCELASMGMNCRSRNGRVAQGNTHVEVVVIECEVCTQAPFDRVMVGVDPRNWRIYNPGFFQSIDVLTTNSSAAGSWSGIIQEAVGALVLGQPIVTNLVVSYLEDKGVAVTAYDLAPENAVPKADDGNVKVDYGFFSVTDEGVHRRIRLLKVLRIENVVPWWFHPLWAAQLAMIGWWFE